MRVEKIVVNGDVITAYITNKTANMEEKIVRKIRLENLLEYWKDYNKKLYEWCIQHGITKVLPGWHGYHYAKVKRYYDTEWCVIDILHEQPIIERCSKRLDRSYFLSHVIPESEYGSWVKNVKVVIKKHP